MYNLGVQLPLTVFCALATVLNGILIPIIATRPRGMLGTYRYLLIAYSAVGLMSSISLCLSLPILIASQHGVLLVTSVIHISKTVSDVCLYIFAVSYPTWALVLTYSFVYRALALRERENKIFSKIGLFLMALFALIVACSFTVFCTVFAPSHRQLEGLADQVRAFTGIDIFDLSSFGGEFFAPGGKIGDGFYLGACYFGFVLPCSAIMFYCTISLHRFFSDVNAITNLSESARIMQRRLFILLILQTMTPLLFSYLPVLASYIFSIFSINLPDSIVFFLSCMLPVAQLLDPIWIFAFIREFRDPLFCCWKKQRPKELTTGLSTVISRVM